MSAASLDAPARQRLLEIARQSIRHGLNQDGALPIVAEQESSRLREQRASFVTLERQGRLRGCIGHLEAITALACDVAENAHAAAFLDPRFAPLSAQEFDDLKIEISVLTPPQPIAFSNEAELLAAIEPGLDGLILREGARRGTFLPSVWAQLPSRETFLRHLKQKAGLAPEHWSEQIQVARYRTESFSE
ncbi:MAG: AmmeMemoRadiSam system protein A [Lamprobacter sp.]|uniref:AmmeMemoRadiSam system protein A n=1 Tax=Lamprobacter sp. TaxID=3100796 RepID=UPI002B259E71|nr:AmmeMemoRadiSam system protein A [Lamprobacter sp.]MEA3639527.1 AmmeMemoRadiSam system protein A [Lamprobacter sp.]